MGRRKAGSAKMETEPSPRFATKSGVRMKEGARSGEVSRIVPVLEPGVGADRHSDPCFQQELEDFAVRSHDLERERTAAVVA